MNNAYSNFCTAIENIRNFGAIYDNIIISYPLIKRELDDMLRAQIVYAVSAMDCYFHEIVRIGMVESYLGIRSKTSKWAGASITLKSLRDIVSIEEQSDLSISQKELLIITELNTILKSILKTLSFQRPDKIKDALSYIWNEEHKMQVIASSIGYALVGNNLNEKVKYLEQKLGLIVTRRDQIAHEADWDSVMMSKRSIRKDEVDDVVLFIEKFVEAIHNKIVIV